LQSRFLWPQPTAHPAQFVSPPVVRYNGTQSMVKRSEAMVKHPGSAPDFDVKEFLRPLLFGLPEEDLDLLAETAAVHTFPEGAVIVREGEEGNILYVVTDGQVGISKQMGDFSERHLFDGGPGDFFGEIAVLGQGRRSATVRATTQTTVLEIKRDSFFSVLGRSPSLAIRFLTDSSQRLRNSNDQAIRDLQQANEELKAALQRIERLDRRKSDFIQISAHELRTPLAVLLGYTQMMEKTSSAHRDPELHTLMDGILSSTRRLHRVFNSILDASRVMDAELTIQRAPVDVRAMFHNILSDLEDTLEEREIRVATRDLQDLPLLSAAPDLLTKAFQYLLNNAIKFTPNGGEITISGESVDVAELGPSVQIVIHDTGIGIAAEDLELIFEKFYRTGEVALYSSGTTSFMGGGPGLGLTIAKGVVDAHGGRIWAESPGYDEETFPGSTFFVQIPLGTDTPEEA